MIPKNWRYIRGDIYYANMEPHVGSEQGGERPVVVLQNDMGNKHSSTLIIATLTSKVDKKLNLPTHVLLDQNPGLKVPSIVQLEQIFTIDKRRVQRFAGQTSSEEMDRIEAALKISLGMNLSSNKV
ncbi:MAG TPA: type II toxin-antitoxin system PemK/MazF family toxin [Candidatus Faecalibacterium faecigallinarum]|uniref:mRNA interferase n=1 Tax=Candidatus Faecalibacterium faecigallinarum TaxID=2838577 RepID=A0A9D2P8N7_9FIRM|nr:type II toxin-antitoxin system PemK/MazF family toxin [Candidatus Faecalibacterium faecigallinarum]